MNSENETVKHYSQWSWLAMIIAWCCYLVALFIPATKDIIVGGGGIDSSLLGWQALVLTMYPFAWMLVLPLFYFLVNVLIWLSPFLIFRCQVKRNVWSTLLKMAYFFFSLVAWTALMYGVYPGAILWASSITLISIGFVLPLENKQVS